MTYRTSNVARLAGAVALPILLAGWGLFSVFVGGETTATTWALGLAAMFPVSGLLVAATGERPVPRSGLQYAVGLVVSVVALSVAYLGVAITDSAAIRTLAGLEPPTLVTVGVLCSLFGAALTFVDVRYVERPLTATLLEERYLDDPLKEV